MNTQLGSVTLPSLEGLSLELSSVGFVNCNPRVPNDFKFNY
jgi:hypothetical protein